MERNGEEEELPMGMPFFRRAMEVVVPPREQQVPR